MEVRGREWRTGVKKHGENEEEEWREREKKYVEAPSTRVATSQKREPDNVFKTSQTVNDTK